MSSATKITDEDDCNDIAYFIGASDETRKTGRDLEPLLNRRDHRINVP